MLSRWIRGEGTNRVPEPSKADTPNMGVMKREREREEDLTKGIAGLQENVDIQACMDGIALELESMDQ